MAQHRFRGGISAAQVAEELGVSKSTVSRALSGRGRVSEQTRDAVRRYLDGDAATGAASPPSHNIAMLVPISFLELDLPFFRKSLSGICRMAAQRGYDVLLCFAYHEDLTQLERQLRSHKVDGILLGRTMLDDPCLQLIRQYDVPYVAIGRMEDKTSVQVDNDNTDASAEMVSFLLRSGVKRLAFLAGSTRFFITRDRLTGYLQGLAQNGLPRDNELIMTGLEDPEQRIDALARVLEQRPDGILCADDNMAYWVLRELQARGIRVPEQLRLASLFDSEMLTLSRPAVTAVQFDVEGLGVCACRTLLDKLAGKETPLRQIHGHQLILRESTQQKNGA